MTSNKAEPDVFENSLDLTTIRSAVTGALEVMGVSDPIYHDRFEKFFNIPTKLFVVELMITDNAFQLGIIVRSSDNSILMIASEHDLLQWLVCPESGLEEFESIISDCYVIDNSLPLEIFSSPSLIG